MSRGSPSIILSTEVFHCGAERVSWSHDRSAIQLCGLVQREARQLHMCCENKMTEKWLTGSVAKATASYPGGGDIPGFGGFWCSSQRSYVEVWSAWWAVETDAPLSQSQSRINPRGAGTKVWAYTFLWTHNSVTFNEKKKKRQREENATKVKVLRQTMEWEVSSSWSYINLT